MLELACRLSTLGQIAQARGWLDGAIALHHQGLAILREAKCFRDHATLLAILGPFVAEKGVREEGCAMLAEAAET
jgi:hypothetical protein